MDTTILQIESIKGNSTITGFEGGINVDGATLSTIMPMNPDVANTERTLGRPSVSDMSFSKASDQSTPGLWAASTAGTKLGKATVTVGRNEGGKFMPQIKVVLGDAMISNIRTSVGNGGASDSFSINFSTITLVYTQQNTDAQKKGTASFGWDLPANKALAAAGG